MIILALGRITGQSMMYINNQLVTLEYLTDTWISGLINALVINALVGAIKDGLASIDLTILWIIE